MRAIKVVLEVILFSNCSQTPYSMVLTAPLMEPVIPTIHMFLFLWWALV